jgi:hypothetical protein
MIWEKKGKFAYLSHFYYIFDSECLDVSKKEFDINRTSTKVKHALS